MTNWFRKTLSILCALALLLACTTAALADDTQANEGEEGADVTVEVTDIPAEELLDAEEKTEPAEEQEPPKEQEAGEEVQGEDQDTGDEQVGADTEEEAAPEDTPAVVEQEVVSESMTIQEAVEQAEEAEEPNEPEEAEPAQAEPEEEPAQEEPAEEPEQEEPAEEPAQEESVEEPAQDEPAEEPAQEEPAEEPAQEETGAEDTVPADEQGTEENNTEETPAEETVDIPAEEVTPAEEEPAEEESTPEEESKEIVLNLKDRTVCRGSITRNNPITVKAFDEYYRTVIFTLTVPAEDIATVLVNNKPIELTKEDNEDENSTDILYTFEQQLDKEKATEITIVTESGETVNFKLKISKKETVQKEILVEEQKPADEELTEGTGADKASLVETGKNAKESERIDCELEENVIESDNDDKLKENRLETDIEIKISFGEKGCRIGCPVFFTADLTKYEGRNYTLQWQMSNDRENWVDILGEDGPMMVIILDESNYQYYWRIVADILID